MSAQTSGAKQRQLLIEIAPVLGVLIVLTLCAAAAIGHPSSLHGDGIRLLCLDTALLLLYALASLWVGYRANATIHMVTRPSSVAGLLLGTTLVVNHLIELFVPARNFALVISPVFFALAVLAAIGSASMSRTASPVAAAVAGLWCALVGGLVLLCVGFAMNLVAPARMELWLKEPLRKAVGATPGDSQ